MTERKVVVIGGGRGFGKSILLGLALRLMAERIVERYHVESAASAHPSQVDGKPRGKGKLTKDWQR